MYKLNIGPNGYDSLVEYIPFGLISGNHDVFPVDFIPDDEDNGRVHLTDEDDLGQLL